MQVYAVALYVEALKAARELGIRDRGGFFKDAPDDDFLTATLDGAFDKLLQVQLVRKIEGSQFYEVYQSCFQVQDLQLFARRQTILGGYVFYDGLSI